MIKIKESAFSIEFLSTPNETLESFHLLPLLCNIDRSTPQILSTSGKNQCNCPISIDLSCKRLRNPQDLLKSLEYIYLSLYISQIFSFSKRKSRDFAFFILVLLLPTPKALRSLLHHFFFSSASLSRSLRTYDQEEREKEGGREREGSFYMSGVEYMCI